MMTCEEEVIITIDNAEKAIDKAYEKGRIEVLDKIRAEIDDATEIHSDGEFYIKNIDVKRIIDKYKAESEDKE